MTKAVTAGASTKSWESSGAAPGRCSTLSRNSSNRREYRTARTRVWRFSSLDSFNPESFGHGRQDETLARDDRETDKDDAVGEVVLHAGGRGNGQAGLADAAGTGQGQQANRGIRKQRDDGGKLALATDERGQGRGQRCHPIARRRRNKSSHGLVRLDPGERCGGNVVAAILLEGRDRPARDGPPDGPLVHAETLRRLTGGQHRLGVVWPSVVDPQCRWLAHRRLSRARGPCHKAPEGTRSPTYG